MYMMHACSVLWTGSNIDHHVFFRKNEVALNLQRQLQRQADAWVPSYSVYHFGSQHLLRWSPNFDQLVFRDPSSGEKNKFCLRLKYWNVISWEVKCCWCKWRLCLSCFSRGVDVFLDCSHRHWFSNMLGIHALMFWKNNDFQRTNLAHHEGLDQMLFIFCAIVPGSSCCFEGCDRINFWKITLPYFTTLYLIDCMEL